MNAQLFDTCVETQLAPKIVGRDVLAALGPSGLLVNVARGSVVDEDALIAALKGGVIASAGLDVFVNEPKIRPEFMALDNVLLSRIRAAPRSRRAAPWARLCSRILRPISPVRRRPHLCRD
jgi:lactate dehydrogenase-like 2-hydroxyacid dehydrogenase